VYQCRLCPPHTLRILLLYPAIRTSPLRELAPCLARTHTGSLRERILLAALLDLGALGALCSALRVHATVAPCCTSTKEQMLTCCSTAMPSNLQWGATRRLMRVRVLMVAGTQITCCTSTKVHILTSDGSSSLLSRTDGSSSSSSLLSRSGDPLVLGHRQTAQHSSLRSAQDQALVRSLLALLVQKYNY